MTRLIDADALIEKIGNEINQQKKVSPFADYNHFYSAGMKAVIKNVIRIVKRMPTIDAVKHGHWILIYEVPSGNYFKCSECNHEVFLKSGRKVPDDYRYCSGCGARMDGIGK